MEHIDWHKIRKVATGHATPQEKEEVEAWSRADEHQKRYLEANREYYQADSQQIEVPQEQVDRAWSIVRRRTIQKIRRNLLTRKIVAATIAAAAVIVVSLWAFNRGEVINEPMPMKTHIILADGTVHEITKSGDNSIEGFVIDANEIVTTADANQKTGNELALNEIVVPQGETYILTLSDHTRVRLNADSRLKFPLRFSAGERKVKLAGEAYFEVTKNAAAPFIVELENSQVKVLGTEFNIKARPDFNTVATLIEGSVLFETSDQSIRLREREQCNMDARTGRCNVTDADVESELAWLKGEFVFKNVTLEQIFDELQYWYGIEVKFRDRQLKNECFHIYLKRSNTITEILEKLALTNRIKYTINENKVELSNP